MPILLTLASLAELALLLAYVSLRRRTKWGPPFWIHEALLIGQALSWSGAVTLLALDPTAAVMRFVLFSCVAQISFTTGCILAISRPRTATGTSQVLTEGEVRSAYLLALGAAAVCLLFVVVILLNEDLGPILLSVITGDEDFISYRLIMSTGRAVYLAPGYVKQFRDVMLPVGFLVLIIGKAGVSRLLLAALWVVGFAAAILSGERSVLMIHVYVLGVGLVFKQGRSAATRRTIMIATMAIGASAFVGFTFLLGRTTIGASIFQVFGEALWGLFSRVALVVPSENAAGFPFWEPLVPTWGTSWFAELAGILPGVQNSFSNDLHALLGGSPLGNSTLGLAPDVYFAYGMVGAAVIPLLYAVILARIDWFLVDSPYLSARIARLAFMPLTLAWYSPFLFILNGGLVLCIFALASRARIGLKVASPIASAA
jgi:hypothetical protein